MTLTLKQLRYLFHVVETGNITRASQELHVAQTALGLQIRALEQHMGLPLLKRHAKGVTPTDAGQILYRDGVALLGRLYDLEERVRSMRSDEIDVRIGLPPSVSTMIGPEIASAELPGVRLQIVETVSRSLMELLARHQIDCALVQEAEPLPDTTSIPVFEQSLVLVTLRGEGAPNAQIAFRDALRFPLSFGPNTTSARMVRMLAHELGLSIDLRYPVDSVIAAKGMVLRGLCACIVPFELVALEAAQGLVEATKIVEPELNLTTSFVISNRVVDKLKGRGLFVFLDRVIGQACGSPDARAVPLGKIAAALA